MPLYHPGYILSWARTRSSNTRSSSVTFAVLNVEFQARRVFDECMSTTSDRSADVQGVRRVKKTDFTSRLRLRRLAVDPDEAIQKPLTTAIVQISYSQEQGLHYRQRRPQHRV